MRPQVWRYILNYVPFHSSDETKVLENRRAEYKNYVNHYTEENLEKQQDTEALDAVKLIKRDILRTLPDVLAFRNLLVQKSMVRILTIFTIRHPSNTYSQGMNDILAPLFLIFLAERAGVVPSQLVADPFILDKSGDAEWILAPEADAYNCFALFISTMKANYFKGFAGVFAAINRLKRLVSLCDPELIEHLRSNQIEILHFAFRWVFCLLLREVPLTLAIKLFDCYLVEEQSMADLAVYFSLALLLRFAMKIKTLCKEEIIVYLQNLPTAGWGEADVRLLASEAYLLRVKLHNACNFNHEG